MRLNPLEEPIIKRVIHTTADFDYLQNLYFSPGAVEQALKTLKEGCIIVTDTQMARSGINKAALRKSGSEAVCFMSDEDVAAEAQKRGITRAAVSMERAAALQKPLIFAAGNAPTALLTLCRLIKEGKTAPKLIIGVPVDVYKRQLLECALNLLANESFSSSRADGEPVSRITRDVLALRDAVSNLVVITGEVFSNGESYPFETARYIRDLGALNRFLARESQMVLKSVAGIPVFIKGGPSHSIQSLDHSDERGICR